MSDRVLPGFITGERSQPPAIDFLEGTYQTKLELLNNDLCTILY